MRKMLWMGYILFGMLMFIVFTYLNFPYQNLKTILVSEFQSSVPAQLRIGKLKAAPPMGMIGHDIVITAVNNQDNIELIKADWIKLRILPLSWIRDRESVLVEIKAYGGSIHAIMGIHQILKPMSGPIDIKISGVDPGRNNYLRKVIAREIAGLVDGELKLQPRPESPWKFQMGGKLAANNVAVNGIKNLKMDLGRLTFSKIESVMAFSDGILHLAPLRIKGREIEGTFDGTLNLKRGLPNSNLNIRGGILIKPVLASKLGFIMNILNKNRNPKGEIPFVLTGTLKTPNLRIAGMKF